MDTVAQAAAGVVSRGRWQVDEEGRVVEEGEIEAPWWLMWYVFGQWAASHEALMARLEEKLREEEGAGVVGA